MVNFGSQLKVQLSRWSPCSRNLRLVPWHQQFRHREQLSWSLFCWCDQMPWRKATAGRERAYSGCGPLQSITVGKSVQKLDESGYIQNREQREWHVLTYSSACFLYYYTIQNPIPRNAAPTFSLGLYPSTRIIMIISRRHAHGHAHRHARRHAYPNMVWTIPCLLSSWQLKITIPATDAHFLPFL